MRVLLCALTGMGNLVLEALLAWPRCMTLSVLTRSESGLFPHYSCGHLDALCADQGIPCRTDLSLTSPEALDYMRSFKPDVLLCATFHQRVPPEVLALAGRAALNIHMSLLPAYRGPTPTSWTILRGERETGISFHQLSEGLDEGVLYAQRRMAVNGRTDGELRLALSELAAAEVCGVLDGVLGGWLTPTPQDESRAFWLPKAGSEEALTLLVGERPPLERLERGLMPQPGPDFLARVRRALADTADEEG